MPSGVYKRTPEHCKAISDAKKGVPYTPEHCAILSKALTGRSLSPEHCAAISAAKKGVPHSPEHCGALSVAAQTSEARAVRSKANKESDAAKAHTDVMIGGNDIVKHHYIYDHAHLENHTTKMTRSQHSAHHHWMNRNGLSVPHINMEA